MLTSLLREYGNILLSVLILTLIFSFLEALAPGEKGQAFSKRLFNVLYFPFGLATVILLQLLIAPYYSGVLHLLGGGLLPQLVNGQSGFVAQLAFALFYAVVFDVWQYWAHRLQHAVPLFWETHKFHHSETALNSSTTARVHVLSSLLFIILYLPVLIIFGAQTPHFVAVFIMFRVWGFVNHTNLRVNLGPLTPLVSGPQWHRIHHSLYSEHHDKNFAAFFPFIDMLFGTYQRPLKDDHPPTGLPSEEGESFLREATISPFVSWREMMTRRLGRIRSSRIAS